MYSIIVSIYWFSGLVGLAGFALAMLYGTTLPTFPSLPTLEFVVFSVIFGFAVTLLMGAVLFGIEYFRMSKQHLTYTWADYPTAVEWIAALREMGWHPGGPIENS